MSSIHCKMLCPSRILFACAKSRTAATRWPRQRGPIAVPGRPLGSLGPGTVLALFSISSLIWQPWQYNPWRSRRDARNTNLSRGLRDSDHQVQKTSSHHRQERLSEQSPPGSRHPGEACGHGDLKTLGRLLLEEELDELLLLLLLLLLLVV